MRCIKMIAIGAAYGVAIIIAVIAIFEAMFMAGLKTAAAIGLDSFWGTPFFMIYTFALMGAVFGALECRRGEAQ